MFAAVIAVDESRPFTFALCIIRAGGGALKITFPVTV